MQNTDLASTQEGTCTVDKRDKLDVAIRRRLVLSSALLLFVELVLIRWLGANIVHLSYFSNFVLLGSFLGGGLGFLRARVQQRSLAWLSPALLAALVAFVLVFPVQVDQGSSQIIYFTAVNTTGLPVWVTLPIVFVAVALIIAGISEIVSSCFLRLPPLDAYRLDLVGSLAGICLFTLLSFFRAPSLVWGLLAALGYTVLLWRIAPRVATAACLAVLVGFLGIESLTPGVSWSPYYKVSVTSGTVDGAPYHNISVNGVPHQAVTTVAERLRIEPIYGVPYDRVRNLELRHVLVIGAGSGTDVAIALHKGARDIDAIEIDPRLRQLGTELNPDHPYADRRVHTHIDDGRAYLQGTKKKYDLVLFALPDSLTLVSGASSIRLESYLFTKEAITEARSHLLPHGAFAMYNYYRKTWLINRYAGTLRDVFGHAPCIDSVGNAGKEAALTVAISQADQTCSTTWEAAASATPAPATDDRPFPYLRGRDIPLLYVVAIGVILVLAALAILPYLPSRRSVRRYADLFFMGTAFLLLETKSVTTFALLFGTTWLVNAIVFTGVLLAVLAAVEAARHISRIPLAPTYAALIGVLALAWSVPASWLLTLDAPVRALTAVALAFGPVFLANLAFSERLRTVQEPTVAFGMNLLGAMLGGCLEYSSLIIGYRDLLIVVAVVYGLAFLLYPRGAPASTGG